MIFWISIKGTLEALSAQLETQERELRQVAERAGWDVAKVYKDHGISGAKGREKRPQFDALYRDANARSPTTTSPVAIRAHHRSKPSLARRRTLRRACRALRSEFPDGRIILVTFLELGQQATVLQLPVTHESVKEPKREKTKVS
jgi:hypothetical protein